jgi:hypothetical protein
LRLIVIGDAQALKVLPSPKPKIKDKPVANPVEQETLEKTENVPERNDGN